MTEEDLLAFVDGETDPQANTVIAAHLATSPQDAALVDSWRRQNELLRATFARVEHEPVPLSLSLKPPRNQRAANLIRLVSPASPSEGKTAPASYASDLARLGAAILLAFGAGMTAAVLSPRISEFLRKEPLLAHDGGRGSALSLQAIALLQQGGPDHASPTSRGVPALSAADLAALGLSVTRVSAAPSPDERGFCLGLSKATQLLTLCADQAEASDADGAGFKTTAAPPTHAIEWVRGRTHLALAGQLPETALLELAQRIDARFATPSDH